MVRFMAMLDFLKGLFRKNEKRVEAPASPPPPAAPAKPVEIGQLLSSKTVFIMEPPEKKSELLKFLVGKICDLNPVIPLERAFQAVMEREKVTSTFMDTGLGVPHARLPMITDNPVALAILPKGLVTEVGPATITTQFVFLFFSPEKQLTEHLQILSKVSWLFQNEALKSKLLQTNKADEALKLIQETERGAAHGSKP